MCLNPGLSLLWPFWSAAACCRFHSVKQSTGKGTVPRDSPFEIRDSPFEIRAILTRLIPNLHELKSKTH